jgi:para-aminobenzoate synthetase/4-amino-4-deoxychorismate lyase
MTDATTTSASQISPADWHLAAATNPGSVLLRTGRPDGENEKSYLFSQPEDILIARTLAEIPRVFEDAEKALKSGRFLCGFLSYEAGYHFEPAAAPPLGPLSGVELPLVWFGVYAEPAVLHEQAPTAARYDPDLEDIGERDTVSISLSKADYCARIQKIREYIAAGDLYQANFTVMARQSWSEGAARLFARIMTNQPVPYAALLNIGHTQILSASPELFFRKQDSQILVRPMKGTSRRGRDSKEDAELAAWLAADEKNRAENVMIVDLLRNDLGRICTAGSIRVTDLFSVERLPELFQMTSTVRGDLKPETTYYDIFRSLFPCGSITGAPKIRTMQVIRELEGESRGIACGAIGFISPHGEAVFSVAIRTLALRDGEFTMRVGSGITYDSDPAAEYEECLLKAKFLSPLLPEFKLIETILWDQGYYLLNLHLDRVAASAEYFDFRFDQEAAREQLETLHRRLETGTRHRVRILLSRSGAISIASGPLSGTSHTALLMISSERTNSTDPFLRHKTTRRAMYDRVNADARARGFDDALFFNERDEVTECAIHNLMIAKDGKLVTPQVECGLLPGIYRQHLLSSHPEIREGTLTLEDLLSADSIFIFNSVRGLRLVRLVAENGKPIVPNDNTRQEHAPSYGLSYGIDAGPKRQ